MGREQCVSVNVHSPRVQEVYRLPSQGPSRFCVQLGNGPSDGGVTLFVSDAEWRALVHAVAEFRRTNSVVY